uniref:Uncharacterized protein n=1 Tax=Vombatus ursinus TaxID=29139 RepID=A0A4X2K2X8_VOMUR
VGDALDYDCGACLRTPSWVSVCHWLDSATTQTLEKLKLEYPEGCPRQLNLTQHTAEGSTPVDFLVDDVFDQNQRFEPKGVDGFLNFKDSLAPFEGLSNTATLITSGCFYSSPISVNTDNWGKK